MKKPIRVAAALLFTTVSAYAQAPFTFESGNYKLSNTNFRSGCAITVTDWNQDGLDDIIRLDNGNTAFVEVQKTGNQFETIALGQMASSSAWAMCVADFDKNGYLDIVGGWNGSCRVLMTNNSGTAANQVTLPNSNFFLQNITAIDANNDGWIDLFTCDDNGESTVYINDGTGNLVVSSIIDFNVTDTDDSGNYGSVWTDFDNDGDLDLYIAKCRQGVNSPTDGRRINVMFVNNGDGTFTENAAEYGINVGWQSWTASFGDIDNDADLDLLLTNHDFESQIFENDGNGYYTDVTATSGFDVTNMTPIQSGFADLDNDGFLDIVITGSTDRIFHNDGDGTFTEVNNLFPGNVGTFSFGDVNHDGKIDLYTAYNTIYTNPSTTTDDIIWLNTTDNENHFFALNLVGTESNISAIGARALIYGDWGVQLREVRAGESYGTVFSAKLQFGLGAATEIDSVVIRWPSGIVQTIENPQVDQFLTVIEQQCVSPEAIVTVDGPAILCAGQALTMSAPAGFEYLWSNGETTQSVQITSSGEYNVEVIDPSGECSAVSRTITVVESPDETPSIELLGEATFCNGGSVQIAGPEGLSAYQWSNGATTQVIEVSESGNYTLTVQGICQEWTSTPITVQVNAPEAPVADDVVIPAPGTATLSATGSGLVWFSDAAGTNQVGIGETFTTPEIETSATYYVSSTISSGGDVHNAGLTQHSGTSVYSGSNATNAQMFFNVFENCTLKSVKVETDTPGDRTIEVRDSDGNLVGSATAMINAGAIQTVDLNIELSPGIDYSISTNSATNQSSLGFAGPRLKRNYAGNNGNPYAYPFEADDLLSITGSSAGALYFFYFYDWQVERETITCYSDPVAVNVTVDESTSVQYLDNGIQVYPNPAQDVLFVRGADLNSRVLMMDASGRIVRNENLGAAGQVSLNGLSAGLYLVQLETNGKRSSARVVVN